MRHSRSSTTSASFTASETTCEQHSSIFKEDFVKATRTVLPVFTLPCWEVWDWRMKNFICLIQPGSSNNSRSPSRDRKTCRRKRQDLLSTRSAEHTYELQSHM